jgi:hypothetical protein
LASWVRLKDRLGSGNYADLELTTSMLSDETHTSGVPATYSRAFRALYGR